MSIENSRKPLVNLEGFIPPAQKENLRNWGLRADDLLAILALLVLTLGATAYVQWMITSCLENAESISAVLTFPW
ncbi:MAG: hypothetical protein EHM14_12530 [Methanothrix sp.]|nr:MAG: hypothetical protein EHM14_12530 [Methanothrix sp.]